MADFDIFPNGTAFDTWVGSNCDKCKKGYCLKTSQWRCDIEKAIEFSGKRHRALLKGYREDIAKRLKWDGQAYLEHDCPEFEAL